MKFSYLVAALLPLAYASPIALEAAEDNSLATFEPRGEEAELLAAFDDIFAELDERAAEFEDDLEDEVEETELEARSTGSILGALKRVRGDISAVNKRLKGFSNQGGPSNSQAVKVAAAGRKLSGDVGRAISATRGSKTLSKKGSKKVFKFVKGNLAPAIKNSLGNFIQKAPGFKKKGFGGTVRNQLGALKGQSKTLAGALISKTKVKKYKKSGKKISASIQKKFSQAISKY